MENTSVPLVGVLISGRGSNLQALIEAGKAGRLGGARIRVVVSNRRDAQGLQRAEAVGIETVVIPHQAYPSREEFDRALVGELRRRAVTIVCLAGFMRLVTAVFCDAFPGAILNIHPSLLPAFPGPDAQRQALAHGVKVSGATVHLVTPELDAGPIVCQAAVAVREEDTVESLAERILAVEHQLYPEAVRRVVEGFTLEGRRVRFGSGAPGSEGA